MKRALTLLIACLLFLGCMPGSAFAKAKQMNDDVPVWTEETVRQYALDYVEGKSMDRLWGYYDLQIRRYLPTESYAKFLTDLEFLTGKFVGLGSYRSFMEPENQLKTHVLHLCMEKQDMDMYFTHKDKEDDWEIMAIEFVPAEKERPLEGDMLVGSEENAVYTEISVTVGSEPYLLEGVLTMPRTASASEPVPACLLLHDFGALDRNMTLGQTKLFEDMARAFAEMGVATLRYDKRTFAYPSAPVETVKDEVIDDALSAVRYLKEDQRIKSVIVLGVGLGGMLTPRVASEAEGDVAGIIAIGSTTRTLADATFQMRQDELASLSNEEQTAIRNSVRNMAKLKEEKARELTLFGRNGYYYWEDAKYSAVSLIKKLKLPFYYAQGRNDPIVSEDDGRRAYSKEVGANARFATYTAFRGLNHLLMNDLSDSSIAPAYDVPAHLDTIAGRTLALWILNLE